MRKHVERQPQPLPHSDETERAVLSAVLLSPRLLSEVASRLRPGDFFLERHQILFRAYLELYQRGTEIDLRTVQALLEELGKLKQVGGLAYLAGLDMDLPDLGGVERYAEIVKDRAVKRRLYATGSNLMQGVLEPGMKMPELLRQAEDAILLAAQESTPEKGVWGAAALEEAWDFLEQIEGGLLGISTGFRGLDRLTNGFVPGGLAIIAGRPSMGKSALALNMISSLIDRGHHAALVSLEMSRHELAFRVLAAECSIELERILSQRLNQRDYEQWVDLMRHYAQSDLWYVDDRSRSLLDVMALARRLKAKDQLDVLFIDYIQLMESSQRYETRSLELGAMTRAFKRLAMDLEISIVVLSQLSRKPLGRADPKPQLGDLRESGSIEQDADWVVFAHQPGVLDPENEEHHGKAELLVRKSRNGRLGDIKMYFAGEYQRFRELDPREDVS